MCLTVVLDIQQVGQLRVDAREKAAQVTDKEQFLATEADNNRDVEKKIAATERTMIKLKQDYHDAERLRDTFNSDVSTPHITNNSSSDLF